METLGLACSDNHRVHTLEAIADQRPRLLLHMLCCLCDRTALIRTPLLFWDITWQILVVGYKRFGTINRFLLRGSSNITVKFNVLLTVHRAMILGNCPTWRTNFFQCIYLFIALYMFRGCHAHHQEKQIVSIQLLVIVTPCWWQCRVLVGSKLVW